MAEEITAAGVDRIRLAVPREVLALSGWLLWRDETGRKVPYYATSGARRHGRQNTPEDQAELIDFDGAVAGARALYARGEHFTGFGLALRAEFALLVLDLDHKREDRRRQALHDELVALAGDTYVERSPSGRGRHVMLKGNGLADAKMHDDGVEVFATAGYVTVTGDTLAAGAALQPISGALAERLAGRREKRAGRARGKVGEGGRRLDLVSVAGRLVNAGLRGEALAAALHAHNRTAYDPPLGDDEVREVVASAQQFEVHGLAWLTARFRFVANVDAYYDLHASHFLSRSALDALTFDKMPVDAHGARLRPSIYLDKASGDGHKFDAVGYDPGEDAEFREESGRVLNLYRRPEITAVTDDASPFTDHLNYLVDENVEAFGHVQSWLAFLVQRPGEKIAHGLLHINRHEGTGRGWLFAALGRVLGDANIATLDEDRLASRFNDHLLRCQLLTIPELETGDSRRAMALRLKPVLADARLRIEQKGLPAFDIANRVNVIASSNRTDATFIGRFDRRWWVWVSEASPQPTDYYDRLYRWLGDPRTPGVILGYLLGVDLANFNPGARPDFTVGKRDVIAASAPAVEQYVMAAIEEESGPFRRPLVVVSEVLDWLGRRGQRGLTPHRLGALLREQGARPLGQKRLLGGARPRVWAVRDLADWPEGVSEALIAETFAAWEADDRGPDGR